MPNYRYKAINSEGKTVESIILAANQKVVIQQLQKLKMTPVSIKVEKDQKLKSTSGTVKVDIKSVLLFTKQLQTLLKAGIPIVTCLNVIKEQSETDGFSAVINSLAIDIEEGSKLSDALNQFPKIFPRIYINSIKVGEVSGTLEETLLQLSSFLEEDERIKKEVKKALRYPSMVIVGLIGAFLVFTTFVIPNFIPIFEASGTELPFPTKVLIGMYYVITNYGLIVLGLIAAAIFGFIVWSKKPEGRLKIDTMKLHQIGRAHV